MDTAVPEQSAPRFGRRRGAGEEAGSDNGAAPPRPRDAAASGWGDAGDSGGAGSQRQRRDEGETEAVAVASSGASEPAARGGKHMWASDGAGGGGGAGGESVAVIRDGDDAIEAAEKLIETVAEAPRNAGGRRVATLQELDGDAAGGSGGLNVAASRAAGIDLSLLTAALYPPAALEERDEVVDLERMLQRITQEMTAEGEKREEAALEDGVVLPEAKSAGAAGPGGAASAAGTTSVAASGRTRNVGDAANTRAR